MSHFKAKAPRKTEWRRGVDDGLLMAATHLEYVGEEKLRDEVLRLAGLTLDDLERSKSA